MDQTVGVAVVVLVVIVLVATSVVLVVIVRTVVVRVESIAVVVGVDMVVLVERRRLGHQEMAVCRRELVAVPPLPMAVGDCGHG